MKLLTSKELLSSSISEIESHLVHPDKNSGLSTGYLDLDNKIGGFKTGLHIIASRPAMGKSTLLRNIAENISLLNDGKILYIDLSQTESEFTNKLLASLSRVNLDSIESGQLDDQDWQNLSSTIEILNEKNNILWAQPSNPTLEKIEELISSSIASQDKVSAIFIDYIQLIRAPKYDENRYNEMAEVSRSLKLFANNYNIPIFACSQLNRKLEERADKRPILTDLRDSGTIEDDADTILFLHRDDYYNEYSDIKGISFIIVGKHRRKPLSTVWLTHGFQWSRFDAYTKNDDE